MTQYLIKFIFYTSGVIGLLLIAYIFMKNYMMTSGNFNKKKGNLNILESLPISPKKTLHIVKAYDEKFLIAADAGTTTLIAKLDADDAVEVEENFSSYIEEKPTRRKTKGKESVIKSMLDKLDN